MHIVPEVFINRLNRVQGILNTTRFEYLLSKTVDLLGFGKRLQGNILQYVLQFEKSYNKPVLFFTTVC